MTESTEFLHRVLNAQTVKIAQLQQDVDRLTGELAARESAERGRNAAIEVLVRSRYEVASTYDRVEWLEERYDALLEYWHRCRELDEIDYSAPASEYDAAAERMHHAEARVRSIIE